MTKREDNGGPAFPQHFDMPSGDIHGMTLRDYFAGQALAGLTSDHTLDMSVKAFAEISYRFADAMLRAREKEGEQ